MKRKFLKASVIIFGILFYAQGAGALVNTQSVLKINYVKENIFLGTSVLVKGTSLPDSTISLSIDDQKNTFAYSITAKSDASGNWSANFDQSLKSGEYYINAIQKDENGLEIGWDTYGPIEIKGSFIVIVGVLSFFVIILLAGFLCIWYMNKLAEIKRYRRILMSQRDAVASYNVLKKDVEKALKDLMSENQDDGKIAELEFLLKRISDNLEKMNKYVVKGINIISKYDIITKIENIFNI